MKPDIVLIKHALSILNRIGPAGLRQKSLMAEMEVAAGRPLTTAEAQDALSFAQDKGWMATRVDDFGQTICWLTDAGQNKLAGM